MKATRTAGARLDAERLRFAVLGALMLRAIGQAMLQSGEAAMIANGLPRVEADATRRLLIRHLAQALPATAAGAEVSLALASVAADSLSSMVPGLFGGEQAQMLVQSQRGRIELLPALPAAWPTGSVAGLRARGGFELAMNWREGEVQALTIAAITGGSTELRWHGGTLPLRLAAGQTARFERRDGRLRRLET